MKITYFGIFSLSGVVPNEKSAYTLSLTELNLKNGSAYTQSLTELILINGFSWYNTKISRM